MSRHTVSFTMSFVSVAVTQLLLIAFPSSFAKDDTSEDSKTLAEVIDGDERFDGLFTLFRDPDSGETHFLVKAEQLGTEFIHWTQVANGAVASGFFKGAYGGSRILQIDRHFDRLEFVQKNTHYYFDPESALSRSESSNVPDALLAVAKIVAEDEQTGDMLIAADPLFKSENLAQITPTPDPDADPKTSFSIGSLDEEKTKILHLRSYPENTDIELLYSFHNAQPVVGGGTQITNPRHVSARIMHSLIEVPDDGFEPRLDDPRIGYFMSRVTDLTSHAPAPYRDVIHRWHLVKKDPTLAVSEPVEPIVWWIENTTPHAYRDTIKAAALSWNQSFEKAGFKNALVIKVQPDDATWDAGDIRYNVLRWTSSPNPRFGGYGPSFANPRTGQLIGSDIMLEYSFVARRTRLRNLFEDAMSKGAPSFDGDTVTCSLGHNLQMNAAFARAVGAALGTASDNDEQIVHDSLSYLILHELGHTLGLNHNMKATNLLTPAEAFDSEMVAETGIAASVMDYPAINFAPPGKTQTLYYSTRPGPYDDWAIEFGYSPASKGLPALLSRSTEPALAFGNDADDMRWPGKGMDPRVNIYDMSSDAITYANDSMGLVDHALEGMLEHLREPGGSHHELWAGLSALVVHWRQSMAVVSRFVGGVEVDRSMVGQTGAATPFQAVSGSTQRRAMDVLAERVFAPNPIEISPELLRHAAQQRRGFDHFAGTEDPKVHQAVLSVQKSVLDQLLHPAVQRRITDSATYGNTYPLPEVMSDLTHAVFHADASTDVNTFRQNLQIEYVQRLSSITTGEHGHDHVSRSSAYQSLRHIDRMLKRKSGKSASTLAHTHHLDILLQRALSTD